jgi:hypothetical protein
MISSRAPQGAFSFSILFLFMHACNKAVYAQRVEGSRLLS